MYLFSGGCHTLIESIEDVFV